MVRSRKLLSALASGVLGIVAPAAMAAAPAASPKLDDVFKSIQRNAAGDGSSLRLLPLVLLVAAVVLMTVAIKHWNRRQAKPKTLNNHRKLMREAARSAGVSRRQLRQIAPLAQANGLSSPLVAIICPSAIKKLAANVKTAEQQEALQALAKGLLRDERKRPR